MINVCVVFGGVSCEHDISIISAMQVISNLDNEKYKVYPVYISKSGKWLYNRDFVSIECVLNKQNYAKECFFIPRDNSLYSIGCFGVCKKIAQIDVVFVVMHGRNGEDGIIKIVSEISGIKCVCSNHLSSALSLDKVYFKKYMSSMEDINVVPAVSYRVGEKIDLLPKILKEKDIDFPVIIKPATLGSSIGIAVCHDIDELYHKVQYSLRFDDKLLIEKKLSNFKEFNIALFRCRDELVLSEIEQPINKEEILSYSDKYLAGSKSGGGMIDAKRIFPAKIGKKLKSRIQNIAKRVYEELDLSGVVRFDFIYDVECSVVYLNELNTIPGSYAHYLFEEYSFSDILDKCIEQEYFLEQSRNEKIEYFSSSVLSNVGFGVKK